MKRRNIKYKGRTIQVEVGIPEITKGLNDEWGVYIEYRSEINPADFQHEIYKFDVTFLKQLSYTLDETAIELIMLDVFSNCIERFYSLEPWKLEPVPIEELLLAQIRH